MTPFEFLPPWMSIPEGGPRTLADELKRELAPGHPLSGVTARAIARRKDNDDVLFELVSAEKPLAVVHLTWRKEDSPDWPYTTFYGGWDDWAQRCMLPDHAGANE